MLTDRRMKKKSNNDFILIMVNICLSNFLCRKIKIFLSNNNIIHKKMSQSSLIID